MLIGMVMLDILRFMVAPQLNQFGQVITPYFDHYRAVFLWMILADIESPFNHPINLTAVAAGAAVLWVFNNYARLGTGNDSQLLPNRKG